MKKHDFGAWFLLCGLLFLFTPGVSAMAEETEPLFAFATQAEEVRPGGSFAVTCTPARGDIGAFVLFSQCEGRVAGKCEIAPRVYLATGRTFCARLHGEGRRRAHGAVHAGVPHGARRGV